MAATEYGFAGIDTDNILSARTVEDVVKITVSFNFDIKNGHRQSALIRLRSAISAAALPADD